MLGSYLCELGRDDQWQQLLEQYPDDASAESHFGRALLAYRRQGDTDDSRALLQAAHAANPSPNSGRMTTELATSVTI